MKSPLQRYKALAAALERLKAARERDLGRAVTQRTVLLDQRANMEDSMQRHGPLGDLVLVTAVRQIGRITVKIQDSETAITTLRRRAVDLVLKAKRVDVLVSRAKRQAELQAARTELAELTDREFKRHASLPQAKLG